MRNVLVGTGLPLLMAATARAAEESHQAGAHPDFLFFAAVFNFGLFVVLLVIFLRKPLAVFLRRRRLELEDLIQRVLRQQEELEKQKKELAQALADLDGETEARLRDAKDAAAREGEQVLAEAQRQAQQIVKDAETRSQQMLRQVAEQAKQEFVDQLLAATTVQMQKVLTAEVDQTYAALVADSFNREPR